MQHLVLRIVYNVRIIFASSRQRKFLADSGSSGFFVGASIARSFPLDFARGSSRANAGKDWLLIVIGGDCWSGFFWWHFLLGR